MSADDTPRERLARLETKADHFEEKLDEAIKKLNAMHDLMMQGQGGMRVFRWATVCVAGVSGYAATYLPKVSTLLGGLPK